MKDTTHTPQYVNFGKQLAAAGIPCFSLKDPRPALPVFGCNQRFGPAANNEKESPSRA